MVRQTGASVACFLALLRRPAGKRLFKTGSLGVVMFFLAVTSKKVVVYRRGAELVILRGEVQTSPDLAGGFNAC